ncbi:MAG: sulfatase [Alphaproteobacteria bacterium]|nr:sulfatase [Alphaproteobacteria bacterium]
MLLLALLLACTRPLASPGVLVVTIDTWRADHLTRSISPHAWRLAQRGTRFTDAWSPIGLTTAAHASLFTGLLPPRHGLRGNNHHGYTLEPQFTTLAERFQAAGWDTGAFVSAWPAGPAGGLDQGFETFSGPSAGERPTAETLAEATAWLEARRRPWFAWVHAYDPHGPYTPPDRDWREVGGGDDDKARYAGEVYAADRMLGPLIERAYESGATVLLTADHGEVHDEERCGWQHERSSSEVVLRVPMVLLGPDVPEQVIDARVGLIDAFPTLLRLAGVEDLGGHQGQDLLGPPQRAVWMGESGLCDPACAAGCAPPGFLGKDRVVFGPRSVLVDRPGVGHEGDPTLAPHLERYAPPRRDPEGGDAERTRALGYTDPP